MYPPFPSGTQHTARKQGFRVWYCYKVLNQNMANMANAVLVWKAPFLKDTHLFHPKEFRTPIPPLSLMLSCFMATSKNPRTLQTGNLLSLLTINFAYKAFSDLTDSKAIYLAIISPSLGRGRRILDFPLLFPPGVFCAASLAAALLHSLRGCQAQTTLSGGLGGAEEPSLQVRGR